MVDIALNQVTAPWFLDEAGRSVFSGTDYGMKSVTAYGIQGLSRYHFAATSNPRMKLWRLQRETNQDWVAYEALWVPEQSAGAVLGHIDEMFSRAKPDWVESWHIMDRRYILPTLRFCAKKAGVEGLKQTDFVRWVKQQETERLQQRLTKDGVPESTAKSYRIV